MNSETPYIVQIAWRQARSSGCAEEEILDIKLILYGCVSNLNFQEDFCRV
jgi:hypothetical protein